MTTHVCIGRLMDAGISHDDALTLRRIAMTLHRWYELECGDSNDHCSYGIERENDDGTGRPMMVYHPHSDAKSHHHFIADKEAGALKRLKATMARYPALQAYTQGDPRGASLYILRPTDVPAGERADAYYSRGIAVYK